VSAEPKEAAINLETAVVGTAKSGFSRG
jgi:hypothetical protein